MGSEELDQVRKAIRLVLKAREDNAVLRVESCDQKLHEVDGLLRKLLTTERGGA